MSKYQLLLRASNNLPPGFRVDYKELKSDCVSHGYGDLITPRGTVVNFAVVIKHVHRKESLITLYDQMIQLPVSAPVLLICNRLTAALIDYCTDHDINFIDTSGNARIASRDFYLYADGSNESKGEITVSRFTEGAMKLLFLLLSYPEVMNESYRKLAEMSGISLGMVSKAFSQLEARRFYRKTKHGRRLINQDELISLWLKDYGITLRSKMDCITLEAPVEWSQLNLAPAEYAGGELSAAELSEGYLLPEYGVIYTPHKLSWRSEELQLKPLTGGKLQLLSRFWGDFELNNKAKVMLCMAELLYSGNDRNREVARIINGKYLHLNEAALFTD